MSIRILEGDAVTMLRTLPSGLAQLAICSPPYFNLRHYGHDGQIGLEATPDDYVAALVAVFREVRRVLRSDGVCVINLGDSYAGSGKGPTGANGIGDQGRRQGFTDRATDGGVPSKNLLMTPFRVALALQADGWILRSVIPWLKRNAMPESVTDRPASAVEYLFMFSKSPRYYWDADAIREPAVTTPEQARTKWASRRAGFGKGQQEGVYHDGQDKAFRSDPNPRGRSRRNSDWFYESWQGLMLDEIGDPLALLVNPTPLADAHYAAFPPKLVEPFVKAGSSERGGCPACGAPWRRVVERSEREGFRRESPSENLRGQNRAFSLGVRVGNVNGQYEPHGDTLARWEAKTTGWQAGCACDAGEPVPQTVLDPFLGSGTSAIVADRLGRNAVGIELSPEYAAMARRRIEGDAPMFAEVTS